MDRINGRHTGRKLDSETGLYYYRARYYDQHVGRFLSEDPLGFVAGINFYAYVENNPVNSIDPSGKFLHHLFGAAAGAGIDIFSQKVLHDKENIDWKSVGASAASGAVGVGLGNAVAREFATFGGRLAANAIGSAMNGAYFQAVQGKGPKEAMRGAGLGALFGGFGSGIGSGITKILSKGSNYIVPSAVATGNAYGTAISNLPPVVPEYDDK